MEQQSVDMPLKDILPTLLDIKENNNPGKVLIVMTGGEPLVRKDLAECGREITKLGFPWGTVSNGLLLTKDKLSELIASGLRTIAISLDGFEDDHNWMRGHLLIPLIGGIWLLILLATDGQQEANQYGSNPKNLF